MNFLVILYILVGDMVGLGGLICYNRIAEDLIVYGTSEFAFV